MSDQNILDPRMTHILSAQKMWPDDERLDLQETDPFESTGEQLDDYCFSNTNSNAVFGLAFGAALGALLAIFIVQVCLLAAMDTGAIPYPPTLQQYLS